MAPTHYDLLRVYCRVCGKRTFPLNYKHPLPKKTNRDVVRLLAVLHDIDVNFESKEMYPESVCDPCLDKVVEFKSKNQQALDIKDHDQIVSLSRQFPVADFWAHSSHYCSVCHDPDPIPETYVGAPKSKPKSTMSFSGFSTMKKKGLPPTTTIVKTTPVPNGYVRIVNTSTKKILKEPYSFGGTTVTPAKSKEGSGTGRGRGRPKGSGSGKKRPITIDDEDSPLSKRGGLRKKTNGVVHIDDDEDDFSDEEFKLPVSKGPRRAPKDEVPVAKLDDIKHQLALNNITISGLAPGSSKDPTTPVKAKPKVTKISSSGFLDALDRFLKILPADRHFRMDILRDILMQLSGDVLLKIKTQMKKRGIYLDGLSAGNPCLTTFVPGKIKAKKECMSFLDTMQEEWLEPLLSEGLLSVVDYDDTYTLKHAGITLDPENDNIPEVVRIKHYMAEAMRADDPDIRNTFCSLVVKNARLRLTNNNIDAMAKVLSHGNDETTYKAKAKEIISDALTKKKPTPKPTPNKSSSKKSVRVLSDSEDEIEISPGKPVAIKLKVPPSGSKATRGARGKRGGRGRGRGRGRGATTTRGGRTSRPRKKSFDDFDFNYDASLMVGDDDPDFDPLEDPLENLGTPSTSKTPRKKYGAATEDGSALKYRDMVADAILTLNNRNGSSREAIIKYINDTFRLSTHPTVVKTQIKMTLKRLTEEGTFIQTSGTGASGSFKLSKTAKIGNVKKLKEAKKKGKKMVTVSLPKLPHDIALDTIDIKSEPIRRAISRGYIPFVDSTAVIETDYGNDGIPTAESTAPSTSTGLPSYANIDIKLELPDRVDHRMFEVPESTAAAPPLPDTFDQLQASTDPISSAHTEGRSEDAQNDGSNETGVEKDPVADTVDTSDQLQTDPISSADAQSKEASLNPLDTEKGISESADPFASPRGESMAVDSHEPAGDPFDAVAKGTDREALESSGEPTNDPSVVPEPVNPLSTETVNRSEDPFDAVVKRPDDTEALDTPGQPVNEPTVSEPVNPKSSETENRSEDPFDAVMKEKNVGREALETSEEPTNDPSVISEPVNPLSFESENRSEDPFDAVTKGGAEGVRPESAVFDPLTQKISDSESALEQPSREHAGNGEATHDTNGDDSI